VQESSDFKFLLPNVSLMDVLAHGLWGGALFGRKSRWQWRWAFLLGTAPDVLAFGPFLISQFGSRDWREFPLYVHQSYNVTHSLVVWASVALAIWYFRKSFPWVLGAWGLHILCDIPLHEIDFFPTPYLWPLPTPLVNGMRWAQPTFIIPNYVVLTVTYALLIGLRYRRHKAKDAP
jgi:membrane-bound metal-dependent hydrolase YbcI (DUF457 family)